MWTRIFTHPLDTCKSRMQVTVGHTDSLVRVWTKIFQREGIRGLYAGFGITFWGSAPATCLYMTSYEVSKNYLIQSSVFGQHHTMAHFTSGIVAEAVCCLLYVPIDVLKERMQVQNLSSNTASKYRGPVHGLKTIFAEEGARGIYKGYYATMLSFGPFSAFYLSFYEQFKSLAQHLYFPPPATLNAATESSTRLELPFWLSLLTGASAGSLASFITTPLDLVKLRLQVQRSKTQMAFNFHYSGFLGGLRSIALEGGIRALFRGASARVAAVAPNTAIFMSSYEFLKARISQLQH